MVVFVFLVTVFLVLLLFASAFAVAQAAAFLDAFIAFIVFMAFVFGLTLLASCCLHSAMKSSKTLHAWTASLQVTGFIVIFFAKVMLDCSQNGGHHCKHEWYQIGISACLQPQSITAPRQSVDLEALEHKPFLGNGAMGF